MNEWILGIHIIGVVCWFAGLFYLPRIFVYHAATKSKDVSEQFKIMEHKLYFYIMYPAMVVTVASGLWMMKDYIVNPTLPHAWLIIKMFFVAILLIFHFSCGHFVHLFNKNENTRKHKFFRIYNEVPTILLIVIIFLAILQP